MIEGLVLLLLAGFVVYGLLKSMADDQEKRWKQYEKDYFKDLGKPQKTDQGWPKINRRID